MLVDLTLAVGKVKRRIKQSRLLWMGGCRVWDVCIPTRWPRSFVQLSSRLTPDPDLTFLSPSDMLLCRVRPSLGCTHPRGPTVSPRTTDAQHHCCLHFLCLSVCCRLLHSEFPQWAPLPPQWAPLQQVSFPPRMPCCGAGGLHHTDHTSVKLFYSRVYQRPSVRFGNLDLRS